MGLIRRLSEEMPIPYKDIEKGKVAPPAARC